jgi:PAS domain S-box-containing protein
VLVADIGSDPLWAAYRELALGHGLQACWSTPIFASDGAVLGTFALYYGQPRAPSDEHLRLIELVSRTAATVIERQRAEDERLRLVQDLEATEARYRLLFAGTGEAIIVIGSDGRYLDANQAASALTGYTVDEIKAMSVGDLSPHRDEILASWPELSREQLWQADSELRHRDGTIISVAVLLSCVELPTGHVYVTALRDISDRRNTERMQRDFVAMVGHELRNPLTSILGFADLMLRRQSYDSMMIERIVAQTRQLDRLVGDLLDTYQLEAGRLELHRERCDLVEIMRSTIDELSGASDHALQLELPDAPLMGRWDPDRIRQVLRNLLSNAIKYSPPGSEVRASIACDGESYRVSVGDHGPGIPPELLPRIFDRFYRAPEAARGGVRGMGIGLFVCRELIQAHGGLIEVTSRVGEGTTFAFYLPSEHAGAKANTATSPGPS